LVSDKILKIVLRIDRGVVLKIALLVVPHFLLNSVPFLHFGHNKLYFG
jgi:hypothetical protein